MIYTKEPWEIHKGSFVTYILAKDGNGHLVNVASVFPLGVAGCETKGNAYLMKAAPKMFEALDLAREALTIKLSAKPTDEKILEFRGKIEPMILQALAEARGEGEQ